jgi:glycosyltransferase involved in cell wall biosynthesis
MFRVNHRRFLPLADRGPLRVMFMLTSMPVGGAETLLVNLIRRLDRRRFAPELCCLKQLGPLGEELVAEVPAHAELLRSKYDLYVLPRLVRLLTERQIDAVVTVGAGDKMFWGRLAAWRARVPVIASALHSTGWPDGVGRLNRLLTPITDAFIGVAASHGRHLVENEGFPARKVHVIPNGVDVERFQFSPSARARLRAELGLPEKGHVVGIVAALRQEKNHVLFLRAAALVHKQLPEARFLIVGDGPEREKLEITAREARLSEAVLFLGTRSDVPELLSTIDVLALTSHNEANPVSILEAMAVERPVVSTRVGSVAESVEQGVTGCLVPPGDCEALAGRWLELLTNRDKALELGRAARELVVQRWSLERMVEGYEQLLAGIYDTKFPGQHKPSRGEEQSAAERIAELEAAGVSAGEVP